MAQHPIYASLRIGSHITWATRAPRPTLLTGVLHSLNRSPTQSYAHVVHNAQLVRVALDSIVKVTPTEPLRPHASATLIALDVAGYPLFKHKPTTSTLLDTRWDSLAQSSNTQHTSWWLRYQMEAWLARQQSHRAHLDRQQVQSLLTILLAERLLNMGCLSPHYHVSPHLPLIRNMIKAGGLMPCPTGADNAQHREEQYVLRSLRRCRQVIARLPRQAILLTKHLDTLGG